MTQVDSRVGTLDLDGEKVIRVEGDNEGRVEIVADLAGYLAKLGLADGELDQMITMLQNERREEVPEETTSGGSAVGGPSQWHHRLVPCGRAAYPQRGVSISVLCPDQHEYVRGDSRSVDRFLSGDGAGFAA